ncbi:MAG TPA: BamA/TamA family outer membrane protein, partial [Pyrinomonadaceae bacterium]|nr:BamA/TamA family outer membrane protein [Pyrinomonadaceae bacterium]
QNLNTIDVGALYFYQSAVTARYSRMIRIAPRMRFGLGLAQTEQSFKKFSLLGEINQELPKLFALNIRGRFEVANSSTPLFEQPSLGGTEVLRGFRQDDAIGRRLWTLQNELKFPVPGTANAIEGIGSFLQQKVRLAGFFDIGNVYQTVGSTSGLRKSPGVGIRLTYYPVEVGVDWAYGFGPAATTGHGRGRIALSVKTFLPE